MAESQAQQEEIVVEEPRTLGWLQLLALQALQGGPIPAHIAFIMDGNRRFAAKRHLPKKAGHAQGFDKLLEVLECCMELGVHVVTVYAFSIENFKRSAEEVEGLMNLASEKFEELRTKSPLLSRYGVRVKIIGDLSLLSASLRGIIDALETSTKDNSRSVLNICFPYTSRHELCHAIKSVCIKINSGKIDPSSVNEEHIEQELFTAGCPPVDLMVRTSGEHRFSDFMLWQSSEALLQFESVLWPDLTFYDFIKIIFNYQVATCIMFT